MESQRVKFLTTGYLRGWLTFDYPVPLSVQRESFILNFLEHEAFTEVLKVKALSESVFTNALIGIGARNIDTSEPFFNKYLNFTLPSTSSTDKISHKGKKNLTVEDLRDIKKFLDEANKQPTTDKK